MNILFVTWDGPQVSYLEGLFLPIFKELNEIGYHFHVIQFTWGAREKVEQTKETCETAGCTYEMVPVIRKSVALGSLISAMMGYWPIRRAIKRYNIDVVLPRSTLPAFSSLLALRGRDTSLIFDADGLPLDERVDFGGQSPSGFVYRLLRDIESQAIRRAEKVLTRSHKASDILLARAGAGARPEKFHVVTNGRDAGLFDPGDAASRAVTRNSLDIPLQAPLLVYAGSIGPQYCVDEMLRLYEFIFEQRPDTHLLVLTGSPEIIKAEVDARKGSIGKVTVMRVSANEVPAYLAASDLGLAFRQTSFSMQGVAPIKLGEYLLCGLPLVATRGIGDTGVINNDVGILVEHMDEIELRMVADWFLNNVLQEREALRGLCRKVGVKHFSLEASVASYQRALTGLADNCYE